MQFRYPQPNKGSAGHWRAQGAVTAPRKLWPFNSVPTHQCGRNSVAECFVANEGVASSILAVRSKQSRSSSAVERRFEEPRAGGSTPSFGAMGNEQGLRLALQAGHAGSVTPVLHHFSGQSRARRTAPPVKRRIGRFDSCDRSQFQVSELKDQASGIIFDS